MSDAVHLLLAINEAGIRSWLNTDSEASLCRIGPWLCLSCDLEEITSL